jgi:hypothetical protein
MNIERPEAIRAWRRFLQLWDDLAAPTPFGLEWDEEVAAEVLTPYRVLLRGCLIRIGIKLRYSSLIFRCRSFSTPVRLRSAKCILDALQPDPPFKDSVFNALWPAHRAG